MFYECNEQVENLFENDSHWAANNAFGPFSFDQTHIIYCHHLEKNRLQPQSGVYLASRDW